MRSVPVCAALAGLALVPSVAAVVDEWTPAGFDWDSLPANDSVPSGLWMHKHEAPETTDLSILSENHPTHADTAGNELIGITAVLGVAWRVASIPAFGVALDSTIDTCTDTANGKASVGKCLKGVFGTVMAFGGAVSATKRLGTDAARLLMPHRFRADGIVDLDINMIPLAKREAIAQEDHEEFVRFQLRSLSTKEPEFLGHAESDHRLAKKEFGTHPHVPMFRFEHFEHGSMEMATRDTLNGTFITAAYTGHPTHLLGRRQIEQLSRNTKRAEPYDKELFKKGVLEARFDAKASHADPATITANAGTLYSSTFEPGMECFIDGANVHDKSILDVQMYDKTNHATFGFGSLGIYNNEDDAHSIESMHPAGMPLPICK